MQSAGAENLSNLRSTWQLEKLLATVPRNDCGCFDEPRLFTSSGYRYHTVLHVGFFDLLE